MVETGRDARVLGRPRAFTDDSVVTDPTTFARIVVSKINTPAPRIGDNQDVRPVYSGASELPGRVGVGRLAL